MAMGNFSRMMVWGTSILAAALTVGSTSAQSSKTQFTSKPAAPEGGGVALAGPQCHAACPADITENGLVDIDDLLQVIGNWGVMGGPADVNGSGLVDIDDLLATI